MQQAQARRTAVAIGPMSSDGADMLEMTTFPWQPLRRCGLVAG